MKSIETGELRRIYNFFAFEQSRLYSGFVQKELPGCLTSLEILYGKKLLKKSFVLGGHYYNSAPDFEEKVLKELNRREKEDYGMSVM